MSFRGAKSPSAFSKKSLGAISGIWKTENRRRAKSTVKTMNNALFQMLNPSADHRRDKRVNKPPCAS